MNKFLTYILPFLGALLFACSQQSEASYVQEMDEAEMVSEEKNSPSENTYYWAVSPGQEQQNELIVSDIENNGDQLDDEESSLNQVSDLGSNEDGLTSNPSGLSTGTYDDQSTFTIVTKDKALKAFVKTNVEDLFDLMSIYKASSQDEEMAAVAKLALEDYLQETSFDKLEKSLISDIEASKKLKLSAISIGDNDNYQGSVNVKSVNEEVRIDYMILSTETAYGTSRKFRIIAID